MFGVRPSNRPGEGWRYRGRGLVQITRKANYTTEGKALGLDLVEHPELLELPKHAVASAGNFWKRKGLNAFADANDITGSTKKINGGASHLKERKGYYASGMACLSK